MIPIAVENNFDKDTLYVEMVTGTTCNYSCSYCFPGCNDGKYRWPSPEQTEIFKSHLSYIFNEYKKFGKKKFVLDFIGGEPTLWPGIGNFAKYFYENFDTKIVMETNASRTLRFWKDNAKYFGTINVSVHNEECDPDHIIEVLDYLYNEDIPVTANVLMDLKNWDRCVDICEKLKAHPTPWLLRTKLVTDAGLMISYTAEQLSYVKDQIKKYPSDEYIQKMRRASRINNKKDMIFTIFEDGTREEFNDVKWYEHGWQKTTGWLCNIGVDRLVIKANGNIEGSCKARNLFGRESALNIYDSELKNKITVDTIQPTICKQNVCACKPELALTKRKNV